MDQSNQSQQNAGVDVDIILEELFVDTPAAHEHRRKISQAAWKRLSAREKQSLKEVTARMAGDDADLAAAYGQAVLVVRHLNYHANLHTNPMLVLSEDDYRFWH